MPVLKDIETAAKVYYSLKLKGTKNTQFSIDELTRTIIEFGDYLEAVLIQKRPPKAFGYMPGIKQFDQILDGEYIQEDE